LAGARPARGADGPTWGRQRSIRQGHRHEDLASRRLAVPHSVPISPQQVREIVGVLFLHRQDPSSIRRVVVSRSPKNAIVSR
jgi:hypothetical protein